MVIFFFKYACRDTKERDHLHKGDLHRSAGPHMPTREIASEKMTVHLEVGMLVGFDGTKIYRFYVRKKPSSNGWLICRF